MLFKSWLHVGKRMVFLGVNSNIYLALYFEINKEISQRDNVLNIDYILRLSGWFDFEELLLIDKTFRRTAKSVSRTTIFVGFLVYYTFDKRM